MVTSSRQIISGGENKLGAKEAVWLVVPSAELFVMANLQVQRSLGLWC